MQQHPLPKSKAETIAVQSQRAIMALHPSAKPRGRWPLNGQRSHGDTKSRATRGYLSAGKLGPIEKIGTSGTFCRPSLTLSCRWHCYRPTQARSASEGLGTVRDTDTALQKVA